MNVLSQHTKTHPNMVVPQKVKDIFKMDVSYHHDGCPSFVSKERKELIYWFQEGENETPTFSIWRTDDEGVMTDDEIFVGYDFNDFTAYLKGEMT